MLESLDKINVKNIVLERGETVDALPVEVTERDWDRIYPLLKDANSSIVNNPLVSTSYFARHAADAAILFPERKNQLPLDTDAFSGIDRQLFDREKARDWKNFSAEILPVPFIAPKILANYRTDSLKTNLYTQLILSEGTEEVLTCLLALKSIFPDFNGQQWKSFKNKLAQEQRLAILGGRELTFIHLPYKAKLLYGKEFDFQIDQRIWDTNVKHTENVRTSSPLMFSARAAELKVLSAESVEYGEEGVEITMPKKTIWNTDHNIPEYPVMERV